jgi:hypothetical protein
MKERARGPKMENDLVGTDWDADQDFVNLELPSDGLAPYLIRLNQDQSQCAQVLKKCCMELHSSSV